MNLSFTLLESFAANFLDKLIGSVIILAVGYVSIKVLDRILGKIFIKTKFDPTLEQFFQSATNWILYIILLLIVLSFIGIDTTPILASLSIVGFVTGFALKDVMANFAAGLMILATKPFRAGDFVKSGDIIGTVERIGIASCVVRTADNLKITAPNSTLWGNPITNFSAYPLRRLEIVVGISYDDTIDKALNVLSKIVSKEKLVLKDPKPEFFVSDLGEYTINIKLWAWVNRKEYLKASIALNKNIKETFEKEKIVMPNPTMEVYMKN